MESSRCDCLPSDPEAPIQSKEHVDLCGIKFFKTLLITGEETMCGARRYVGNLCFPLSFAINLKLLLKIIKSF